MIWMPALLIRMSTPEKASITPATPLFTAASSVTSIATPMAWAPLSPICLAVACAALPSRSAIATLAPSRAKTSAMSLPMPLAAPVMRATLSLSFMRVLSSWGSARQIDHANPALELRRLEPVGMGAGAPHVVEAGLPELAHRGAGEFVVLRIRGVGEAPVDQVGDGDLALVAQLRLQQVVVGIFVKGARQLVQEPAQRTAQVLELLHALGVEARLARIADVLLALEHLVEVRRQLAGRAEQVDLHDQGIDARRIVHHVPQRRVGDDAAVPVVLAVDHHGRKTRRQRAARHDVLGAELAFAVIEIDRIAGVHVDRADAQAHVLLAVQEIEIDQLAERPAQRRGVVDAERPGRGIRCQQGRRNPWREEPRHAEARRGEGVEPVQPGTQRRELRRWGPGQSGRDPIPELAQPLEPLLDRIARDQRAVDGTDRHARHPVRRESLFRHAFVDTGLVRAEGTAALQYQTRVLDRHAPRLAARIVVELLEARVQHQVAAHAGGGERRAEPPAEELGKGAAGALGPGRELVIGALARRAAVDQALRVVEGAHRGRLHQQYAAIQARAPCLGRAPCVREHVILQRRRVARADASGPEQAPQGDPRLHGRFSPGPSCCGLGPNSSERGSSRRSAARDTVSALERSSWAVARNSFVPMLAARSNASAAREISRSVSPPWAAIAAALSPPFCAAAATCRPDLARSSAAAAMFCDMPRSAATVAMISLRFCSLSSSLTPASAPVLVMVRRFRASLNCSRSDCPSAITGYRSPGCAAISSGPGAPGVASAMRASPVSSLRLTTATVLSLTGVLP